MCPFPLPHLGLDCTGEDAVFLGLRAERGRAGHLSLNLSLVFLMPSLVILDVIRHVDNILNPDNAKLTCLSSISVRSMILAAPRTILAALCCLTPSLLMKSVMARQKSLPDSDIAWTLHTPPLSRLWCNCCGGKWSRSG